MATKYLAQPVWHETWDNAIDIAATKAKDWFPPVHHARIDKAVDIALEGRIMILRSGDAIVESDESTPEKPIVYKITRGHCECPDSQYRSPWCKHNIARGIMIRAAQHLSKGV